MAERGRRAGLSLGLLSGPPWEDIEARCTKIVPQARIDCCHCGGAHCECKCRLALLIVLSILVDQPHVRRCI